MRTKNFALSIGALLAIAGCAGNAPKPKSDSGLKPDDLVTYNGGKVTRADWSTWKKNNQVPATLSRDEEARQFGDYVKFRIDSLAARDAGITKDSNLVRRWASISQRIIAERYRIDVLEAQYGIDDTTIARYLAAHPELASQPKDSARIKAARAIALTGIKLDSIYALRKDSFKRDSVQLPLDSVREQIITGFLQERSERLSRGFPDIARKLYKVDATLPTRPEPANDSLLAIYKADAAARFSAPATFHMKALGSKDSASLAKALVSVKDLASFQALSAKFPVGTPIHAPKGDLGRVKRQFALPYGLGLAPSLFNELEPTRTGLVSPQKIGDSIWVAFWVDAVDSGAIKPFETVKSQIRDEYLESHPWTPAPSAVLAKWDRGPLATQSDLDFLYQEIPAQMHRQYPPQRVIEFMTLWACVSRASKESGHSDRPEVSMALADNLRIYWSQEWRKSVAYQTFGIPSAKSDSTFKAWAPLFKGADFVDTTGANRDGARLYVMPAGYLKSRFAEDYDRYRKDSVFTSFDSAKKDLFRDVRSDLDNMGRAHLDSVQRVQYNVITSPAAPGLAAKAPASVRLDSARALHDRRVLEDAQRLYESVESDVKAPDSLRAQALFQLGQLFGEQQTYPLSLSRYRAVLSRFPKSNEAYKAQFMIAFTYSEYLKEEKLAVKEYKKVLVNYPTCDLKADADWMIRNIESGGALMPKFDDTDTAAASAPKSADTAKATSAKAESTKAPAAAVKVPAKVDTVKAPVTPAKVSAAKVDSTKVAASKPAAKADSSKAVVAKPAAPVNAKAAAPAASAPVKK